MLVITYIDDTFRSAKTYGPVITRDQAIEVRDRLIEKAKKYWITMGDDEDEDLEVFIHDCGTAELYHKGVGLWLAKCMISTLEGTAKA